MNIQVHRYPRPTPEERAAAEAEHPGCRFPADDWQGWIEPEDKGWIAFIQADGRPVVYLHRDEDGGVVDAGPRLPDALALRAALLCRCEHPLGQHGDNGGACASCGCGLFVRPDIGRVFAFD